MYAVEFQARITDGTIEVPEEYRHRFDKPVRVIILVEEIANDQEFLPESNILTRLLEHPLKIKGFKPLTRDEIYDRT